MNSNDCFRTEKEIIMKKRLDPQKKGTASRNSFTLIELLITIMIIAILAAILLPALNKGRMKARQIQCTGNLKQISSATHMYLADNGDNLPYVCDTATNVTWDDLLGIGRYDGRSLTWNDAIAVPLPFHRRTTTLYMCPEHNKNDSSRRSYSIVSSYVGGSTAAPGNPENTHGVAFREWSIKLSKIPQASATLMYTERPSDVNYISDSSCNNINSVADQYGPGAELVVARSHLGRHVYVFSDGHIEVHHPLSTISPQGGTINNPKGIWTWTPGD